MKIASVRPVRAGQFLYARVETADGVVGWGESGAWGHLEASATAVEKFADYLVGEDPRRIELHWNVMQRFAHFRGHAVNGAVSAIDIALWDIAGQALGVPVHQLLGGAVRDEARLYGHVYAPTIDEVLEELKGLRTQGFTAVGHINPFLDEAEADRFFKPQLRKLGDAAENVARFREAAGDGMDLLLELHRRLNPSEADRLARLVEPYEPMWLEDPIRPEFHDEMGALAARIPVPIATGERFTGPTEFKAQFARGPIGFARVSTCVVGGITGAKKAAAIAEAFDIPIAPHNPLSPVGLCACLQVAAAVPNFAIQEYPTGFRNLELRSDGALLGAEFVDAPPRNENGFVRIPTRPGLGVSVLEDVVVETPPVTRKVSMRRHRDGSPIDQ
ncbi:mandelate racemase/muconate lactonizing enzyme family protein [Hansschlegelia zhihuaiae]|uniref:Mandelate racemase/muconate lactonizing enzyme family protein n=1 Tax=Hansschlegelia zhihuaiae TaxID=405005 RepID=A0A4Q0MH28_9HYPH|nr:mandelate racemase/muconate lactonizing enzyme family protein [Hansschlegelia zhihuaiae]RXF72685.1 mandelate racemase/muconate lactonizing enzyme family protein [Hansschlegelia zhihuaiae]